MDFNKVKLKKLDKFVHSYEVKGFHDYLLTFKDEIIQNHRKFNQHGNEFLDKVGIPLNDIANAMWFNTKVCKVFEKIADHYYWLGETVYDEEVLGIYIQNNNSNVSSYHHHHQVGACIAATTYINPPEPEEGGGLQVFLHENHQMIIQPKKDHLYFFPSWLLHRPLPQKREDLRISLNWIRISNTYPIHKITGDRW